MKNIPLFATRAGTSFILQALNEPGISSFRTQYKRERNKFLFFRTFPSTGPTTVVRDVLLTVWHLISILCNPRTGEKRQYELRNKNKLGTIWGETIGVLKYTGVGRIYVKIVRIIWTKTRCGKLSKLKISYKVQNRVRKTHSGRFKKDN